MAFTGQFGTLLSRLGNIQLGKGASSVALPNNPASAVSQGGYIPLLNYIVYDPFGNVVIPRLPHPHRGKWDIKGLMPGQVGDTVIGSFDIPLFTPGTPEWGQAQQDYSKLDVNYRIEGYLGDVDAGDPRVSGIIRERPTSFNDFTIKGVDSIALLSWRNTGRVESFVGTTDQLFQYGLKAYTGQLLDDFTGTFPGTVWTNNGNLSKANNPVGNPSLLTPATTSGDGLVYSQSTYGSSLYADCYLDAWFYLSCATTVNSTAEGGLIAAVQDANNFVLGRAFMRRSSTPGRYEIDAEIQTKNAGVLSLQKRVTGIVVVNTPNALIKVTLIGTQIGPTYQWQVVLNGAPSGCIWQYGNTPYGQVGVRMATNSASTNNFIGYVSNFVFIAKQNAFTPGSITAGTKTISQTFSNAQLLDLINLAATVEGYTWRKNPKRITDTIDFGPSVGSDYTSRVFFVEGRNLNASSSVEPNTDPPITVGRLLGSPGQDNAGFLEWVNIPAANKYGLVYDNMTAYGAGDFGAQQALVQKLVSLRSTPGVAKKLKVIRDIDTADIWREQDFVSVTSTRLGLFNQSVQVMGWTLEEGNPEQELIGDQYPKDHIVNDLRNLRTQLDALASGVDDVSPTASSSAGIVYDSRYGSPTILNFSGGYQSTTAFAGNPSTITSSTSNQYRLIFQIPTNYASTQRIFLSSLMLTTGTVGGTTSTDATATTPSTDASGESGHSHNHGHSFSIPAGAFNFNLGWLNGTGVVNNSAGNLTDNAVILANANGSSGHSHSHNHGSHSHSHSHTFSPGTSTATNSYLYFGPANGTLNLITGFGPFTTSQFTNIDLTSWITQTWPQLSGTGFGSGSWELQVTSQVVGGIVAQIMLIGIVKSL